MGCFYFTGRLKKTKEIFGYLKNPAFFTKKCYV